MRHIFFPSESFPIRENVHKLSIWSHLMLLPIVFKFDFFSDYVCKFFLSNLFDPFADVGLSNFFPGVSSLGLLLGEAPGEAGISLDFILPSRLWSSPTMDSSSVSAHSICCPPVLHCVQHIAISVLLLFLFHPRLCLSLSLFYLCSSIVQSFPMFANMHLQNFSTDLGVPCLLHQNHHF